MYVFNKLTINIYQALLRLFFMTVFSLSATAIWAQITDTLFQYKDYSINQIGYKDKQDSVVIASRFRALTLPERFSHVIGVIEEVDGQYHNYYYTRQGDSIAYDSLYMIGYKPDCEYDGYIRFRDRLSDLAGLLDHEGHIVIPAEYSDLKKVHNGTISVLRDAVKQLLHTQTRYSFGQKYIMEHRKFGCNHYNWLGGVEMLIDTNNIVLIDSMTYNGYLDYYSMQLADEQVADTTKVSFRGVDGRYYIFDDVGKTFRQWAAEVYISSIDEAKIANHTMDSIAVWKSKEGLVLVSSQNYLRQQGTELLDIIRNLDPQAMSIRVKELNPYLTEGPYFDRYFDHCGDAILEKYPVIDIIIGNQNTVSQDYLSFLKTDAGYRLINVTLRSRQDD